MSGLHVVALISGGKDSLFSILHCQANGHKVVALANLRPPEQGTRGRADDLESYFYQTVGHAVIPLYEHALGLPLYRQDIVGSAVNSDKCYKHESGIELDETEDMIPLLRKVMAAHPEVNAVTTGAILSDYQRTRVESVALRLGLVPLSYLWQWPTLPPQTETSLLEDMEAVGQEARIVKVSSGGLDESFIWLNVADRRTIARLSKAAERFGTLGDSAVLGEGGEFETLAVDGPPQLWKGRIVVDDKLTTIEPGEAGSASLRISGARVEMKQEDSSSPVQVRIPSLFDPTFSTILAELISGSANTHSDPTEGALERIEQHGLGNSSSHADALDDPFTIAQLCGEGENAAEQTRSIMDTVVKTLTERSLGPSNIAYTTIVLRSMQTFATVNAVYGSYFTEPNPPARLTIACADVLPKNAHLMMGFTCTVTPIEGLHVQSRSYWAPANIGPYSQATKHPVNQDTGANQSLVYVAGQIPLVPASMELVKSPSDPQDLDFMHEAVLSLQHLDRIGRVKKVRRWISAIAFVTGSLSDCEVRQKVPVVQKAWETFHTRETKHTAEANEEDEEGFDVWDLHNRRGPGQWRTSTSAEAGPTGEEGHDQSIPPLHIICVDALPRGSAIEWVSYGQTSDVPVSTTFRHLDEMLRIFQERTIACSM